MDPKALLLKHFEKLIFAVFGVWLGMTLVGFTSPPAELKSNETIAKHIAEIQEYMGKTKADVAAQTDVVSQLEAGISKDKVRTVDAKYYPGWLAHRRPNLAYVVEGGPTRPQPVHNAPTDFTGSVERGRVKLSWQPADPTQNAFIIIDAYELQRREIVAAGEQPGSWTSLGQLKRDQAQPAPPTEWVDEKVQPRKKYEYKLIETAILDEDNQAIAAVNRKAQREEDKVKLPDLPRAPVEREVTWAMEKEIPRDVYIVPAPGTAQIPDPAALVKGAKPTVTLKVYKFDPKSNAFVEKQYFSVAEGTKSIGKPETVKGNKIDFTTGAELVEVRAEEREVDTPGGKLKKNISIIKIKWAGIDQPEEIDEVNLPEEIAPKKPEKTPPKPGAGTPPAGGGSK